MTAFDSSILRRLTRINEVVDDIVVCTKYIECMQCLHGHVTSFVRAEIVVREYDTIVSFDCLYAMIKSFHDFREKSDRVICGLFVVYRKVSPPRSCINGCILKISLARYLSGHILHIDLHELSGFAYSPNVLVGDLSHSILPNESLFL